MATLLPPCYDSDSELNDQTGSVDHDSRQKLPWSPGTALTGNSLQDDESEVRTDNQACTDLNGSHATQEHKTSALELHSHAADNGASNHILPASPHQGPTGSSPTTHPEGAVDSHPTQTLSPNPTQTAPVPTTLPVAELQKCTLTNPSALSLPHKCQAPTDLATVSMKDPTGVPPPAPEAGPPAQPAPGSLAVGLVQLPDADTTLASSVASAAAHFSLQRGGQAAGSTRGTPTAPALPPTSDQVSAPDEGSMNSSMKEHASKPSSHETVDHPASASLTAPTGKQAADPVPDQICHRTANSTGSHAPTLPQAQASHPLGTGLQALDPKPTITADDPAGTGLSATSADQQLPTGKPSAPPPPMVATTDGIPPAVAPSADQQLPIGQPSEPPPLTMATTGGVPPAVATAVPAVRTRPKRASRSRGASISAAAAPATGAKFTAASFAAAVPAASLTAGTTKSGQGRGVELVGQRIEVWWSGNKEFFSGTVKGFTSKGHRVKYDDGTCEHEDLTHRAYKLPGLAGDTVFNPDADVQSPLVAHTPPTPGAKSGMALVGQRIQVWWAQDEEFYPGVIKSYKKGRHRVVYDDGEVGFEDLQHKKHKLPELHGDQVFNPDADAVSSSEGEDVMLPAGISTGEKKSNGAAAAAAAPNSGQAVESGTPLDVHVKANGLHDVDDTDSFGKGPAGPAMHAAAALPPCGKPASQAASPGSGPKHNPGAKHVGADPSPVGRRPHAKLNASPAVSASLSPNQAAAPAAALAAPAAPGHELSELANSSAAAHSHAVVSNHSSQPPQGQLPIDTAPLGVSVGGASHHSQIQPQLGIVLIPNQLGLLVPAGPLPLVNQPGPQPPLAPQPDPQPAPQPTTAPQSGPQPVQTPKSGPQLVQQSHTAGPSGSDAEGQLQTQSAANLLPFLPQHADQQLMAPHPATAPAWAADHLQVLKLAPPQTQHQPDAARGVPAASQIPSAGPQIPSAQPCLVYPAQSGMHHSQRQTPSLPTQSPGGASADAQAAAGRLASQTDDTQTGRAALQVTGAVPEPATAVVQASTAEVMRPTTAAVAPLTEAHGNSAQAAPHLPAPQDAAAAPAAAAPAAAVSPVSAHEARDGVTPGEDAAGSGTDLGSPPQAGSALAAGQALLASQDSDSPAASSLQGYLALASPGSISKLKQDLKKEAVTPAAAPAAARALARSLPPSALPLEDPDPRSTHLMPSDPTSAEPVVIHGQQVLESLLFASETDRPMVEAAETVAQPAAAHTSKLQAGSANVSKEAMTAAAVQQQAAAESAGQLDQGGGQDPRVAATLKQYHDMSRDISDYASRLTDPVMKQRYADALAGRPVSPLRVLTAGASSTDDSSSDSDSDSDAEPAQDSGAVLLPAPAAVNHVDWIPHRQSSNRASNPSARPSTSASGAHPHQPAQRTLLHSPLSPGLHPAQPSTSRPQAMRSVGQLHSAQNPPLSKPARFDRASPDPASPGHDPRSTSPGLRSISPGPGPGPGSISPSPSPSPRSTSPGSDHGPGSMSPGLGPSSTCPSPGLPEQATTGARLNHASSHGRALTTRAFRKQGSPPGPSALLSGSTPPDQATAVTRGHEQSAGRKRGGGSSGAHIASLPPGAANGTTKRQKPPPPGPPPATLHRPPLSHAPAASEGPTNAPTPALGPGPFAPPWLQQGAILEGRQLAGHGAASNIPKAQEPAANGQPISTALVLHQSAPQPVRQAESARPAAHSPALNAANALTVVPDRHAVCVREEDEVAAKLQDLVIAAEGYRVFRCYAPAGYEVWCLLSGMDLDDVRMTCSQDGNIDIYASPKPVAQHIFGAKPVHLQLRVPGRINPDSARATLTLHGQYYVRVNSLS